MRASSLEAAIIAAAAFLARSNLYESSVLARKLLQSSQVLGNALHQRLKAAKRHGQPDTGLPFSPQTRNKPKGSAKSVRKVFSLTSVCQFRVLNNNSLSNIVKRLETEPCLTVPSKRNTQ
jgi:hypothetical protein